ncbi:hypothetical protein [Novosphingobium sp. B 225]|uniref:hypothetical protein n=1 Tax=Novosphingobium sp. B 225 TaxID=1961849 RepID=UPI001124EB29|nr:hypothetical protein [Novosphingobium sp. B 225]
MSKIRARDRVTASFHFLNIKIPSEDGGDATYEGFDSYQIEEFKSRLLTLPTLDLSDEGVRNSLRTKKLVPIDELCQIDERTFFGKYRGAYWGHGYENTHAGYIPPESISLRPFYFLLYFSTDGKIYLGTQYLGQFGSYTALKNSLFRIFTGNYEISAHSFRSEAANLENVQPKEVRIVVSSSSKNANSDNIITSERLTVLKSLGRGSHTQSSIKTALVVNHKNPEKLREEVSKILRQDKIISFDDDDIVDCVIVAELNGRPFVLHFMEEGIRATKFEIKKIMYELDGHPGKSCVKDGMIEILEKNVLSKGENA